MFLRWSNNEPATAEGKREGFYRFIPLFIPSRLLPQYIHQSPTKQYLRLILNHVNTCNTWWLHDLTLTLMPRLYLHVVISFNFVIYVSFGILHTWDPVCMVILHREDGQYMMSTGTICAIDASTCSTQVVSCVRRCVHWHAVWMLHLFVAWNFHAMDSCCEPIRTN